MIDLPDAGPDSDVLSALEARCGDVRADIPVPSLAGALIAKSIAVTVDDAPANQRIDLAFLYSIVDDLLVTRNELGAQGRKLLARRGELADRQHEAWRALGQHAQRGYDAMEHNRRWLEVTRPMLEAFWHTRFFVEMAVKYGQELDEPPSVLPSGWAALLYLYELR